MPWHCGKQNCPTHSSPSHRCQNWRLSRIRGSVGRGGSNQSDDIVTIQGALNGFPPDAGGPASALATNGVFSELLNAAIAAFQRRFFGNLSPDGRVDVRGNTYKALAKQLHYKWIGVDLSDQIVQAFEDGRVVHRFECVSGDSSHPTDRGTFSILRKAHPYRSRTYDVQMDYALFFTSDGKAIHQYHGAAGLGLVRTMRSMSDWFGSHGCVRLEESNARTLYNWASVEMRVSVY